MTTARNLPVSRRHHFVWNRRLAAAVTGTCPTRQRVKRGQINTELGSWSPSPLRLEPTFSLSCDGDVAHKTKSKELPVCSFCVLRFASDGRPPRSDYVCDLVCHDDAHLRSAAVTHCCHSMLGALLISESSVRCSFQKARCAAHFRKFGALLISFQNARCAAHFRMLDALRKNDWRNNDRKNNINYIMTEVMTEIMTENKTKSATAVATVK